jgi:uncharacterized protein (DUF305 family)
MPHWQGQEGETYEQTWLRQMIMHHAMGVMMTRPLAERAEHEELRALAVSIIAAQTAEIAQMRGWLRDWYGVDVPDPVAMMAGMPGQWTGRGAMMPGWGMGGMGMGMGAGPMMAQGWMMGGMGMMEDFWTLPAPRLEATFMSLMIPHHQDAIDMAGAVPGRGVHEDVERLAERIIATQRAENAQMTAWLAAWYGL